MTIAMMVIRPLMATAITIIITITASVLTPIVT